MHNSTVAIRKLFLDFFCNKGHKIIESSSLIPKKDSSLLFTNAGMNQFKDIFLGLKKSIYSKVVTSQRCVRAGGKHNDLKNVGYTKRHHTFFEMLGNFSFGDYFKYEAITYAWELLTSKDFFNLSKEKLWITTYVTDNETFNIWKNHIGIPIERIIRVGNIKESIFSCDNFWQMGNTGPCGPCTEIFYDLGDHMNGNIPGSTGEYGDRYIEIWNIVFMQFKRYSDGSMKKLLQPSVDTGMGLERISTILQNVNSSYEIDIFRKLIFSISKIICITNLNSRSLCVIADHIRSCAFLISDGIIPSNEGRGYVLRRIIRRAIRHGKILGIKDLFFYKLVQPLIEVMGSVANSLKNQKVLVEKILKYEEEQFISTLDRGLILLESELNKLKDNILNKDIVFRLYDTYGFPVDLTLDICRERNIRIDEVGFYKIMEIQRLKNRISNNFNINYNNIVQINNISQFSGYINTKQKAIVIAILCSGKFVKEIHSGEEAIVILDTTPFYSESGGQVGDKGFIKNMNINFLVNDTKKYNQAIGHKGKLLFGTLKVKDSIVAQIDIERRNHICLNHSATHLLHSALRTVLGTHVVQKGSFINEKYLRFDFLHFKSMKLDQIHKVINLVNQQIRRNLLIKTEIMSIQNAKDIGAIALFNKKYYKNVRVLIIGDISIEICGGTHTNRTGDIGLFYILTETAISTGIRRIEAVTGNNAIIEFHKQNVLLQRITNTMKADSNNIIDKLNTIINRTKILEKELKQLQNKQIIQKSIVLSKKVEVINGMKLLISEINNTNIKMLRNMIDHLKNQIKSGIIILSSINNNKITLIVGVTKDLIDRISALELINNLAYKINGKGGGRSDIAQAGGIDINALPMALNSVKDWIISKTINIKINI
ncbi:Alanine--tRNA ligase [Serratia symbiotica]|nr:Alanine--tRNA ligase [Serratia symbiotica]